MKKVGILFGQEHSFPSGVCRMGESKNGRRRHRRRASFSSTCGRARCHPPTPMTETRSPVLPSRDKEFHNSSSCERKRFARGDWRLRMAITLCLPAAPESVKSATFKCAWAMSGESEILELTPQFHTFLRARRPLDRADERPRKTLAHSPAARPASPPRSATWVRSSTPLPASHNSAFQTRRQSKCFDSVTRKDSLGRQKGNPALASDAPRKLPGVD
jgi:hypothetical protein